MTLNDPLAIFKPFKVTATVNAAKLTNVSVTWRCRDIIGRNRNTSKIIPRLISLMFSVCRDHNIMDALQRGFVITEMANRFTDNVV